MYWKFTLVNLLLVLPNTWILTSASLEKLPPDGGTLDNWESNDDVIEEIIHEYNRQQAEKDIAQGSLDKKDQQIIAQNADSNNKGINLDVQDPPPAGQPVSSNDPPGNKSQAAPGQSGGRVVHAAPGQAAALQQHDDGDPEGSRFIEADDKQFIIIVAVAVSTGFVGLMLAGVCYYKFRKSAKEASDVEYPAYGITGPVKERIPSPGDRKLAQSAQMYHYQHQKQQMIAMEKANGDMKHDASDDESEEDNIEGDYTVYECPGLAPTGEMEVRNPLFRGDDTPVTPGEDITGQPHGEPTAPPGNQ